MQWHFHINPASYSFQEKQRLATKYLKNQCPAQSKRQFGGGVIIIITIIILTGFFISWRADIIKGKKPPNQSPFRYKFFFHPIVISSARTEICDSLQKKHWMVTGPRPPAKTAWNKVPGERESFFFSVQDSVPVSGCWRSWILGQRTQKQILCFSILACHLLQFSLQKSEFEEEC